MVPFLEPLGPMVLAHNMRPITQPFPGPCAAKIGTSGAVRPGPKPSLAASVISGVSVKRSGTSRAGASSDLFWCGLPEGSSAAMAEAGWGHGNMARRGGCQQRRVV